MWKITKDHIEDADGSDTSSRVGTSGESYADMLEAFDLPTAPDIVEFRLYDDDGELYYEGWLHDDDECQNQMAALAYGRRDAGTTSIKVKRGNAWKEEIG